MHFLSFSFLKFSRKRRLVTCSPYPPGKPTLVIHLFFSFLFPGSFPLLLLLFSSLSLSLCFKLSHEVDNLVETNLPTFCVFQPKGKGYFCPRNQTSLILRPEGKKKREKKADPVPAQKKISTSPPPHLSPRGFG